jgi:hypothetical protein
MDSFLFIADYLEDAAVTEIFFIFFIGLKKENYNNRGGLMRHWSRSNFNVIAMSQMAQS